jgi:EmrB/QacA subfamily drug resistance transporter
MLVSQLTHKEVFMSTNAEVPAPPSFLATHQGKLTLLFLCMVGFLDFVDASIVNIALPSIRRDLGFSVQNLQWVLSGYLLTYGGLTLLGGRSADLLGRRRVLATGIVVFALSSLAAGVSQSDAALIAARLVQGTGAAMMLPAALSILTTTFSEGTDRYKALGAWGAVAGLASAVGVFLGGVITEAAGWRWVFWVNLPVSAVLLVATFRIVSGERPPRGTKGFDALGAVLVTSSLLLFIYTLVEAPTVGWGTTRTVAGLAAAGVSMLAFVTNERRHRNPLMPLSIFRIPGLAAADATMMIAIAGFYSMFFFITLYMQNVLEFSQIQAGAAYVPVTLGVAVSAAIASNLFARVGTRPIVVTGALLAAGAVFWLSRIPVGGSYLTNLLPGLMIMSFGLGFVFVGVQTAANAGVPADEAGLAAALVNTSTWIGGALGLAIFSVIATTRTTHLLAANAPLSHALTSGFQRALVACSIFLVGAALIALRATNTRGEPAATPALEPASDTV